MKFYIVYDRERYIGNEKFGELLGNALRAMGCSCSVAMIDSVDFSEHIDGVIMRTYDADFSMMLKSKGIRTFNNIRTQSTGRDKAATYAFARSLGIPIPESHVLQKGTEPLLPFPFVLKSRFGHGGTEVYEIRDLSDYHKASDSIADQSFIVQRMLERGMDKRLYVLGGDVVIAFMRSNENDFRSNYKLGGKAIEVKPNRIEIDYARRAAAGLKADFIGVDFLYDRGNAYLNEIEDIVGSRMVYENSSMNILDKYARYIIAQSMHR